MNKYAQHYFNAYANKIAEDQVPKYIEQAIAPVAPSAGNTSFGRDPITGAFNSPSAQGDFSKAISPKFTLGNNQGSAPADLNIRTGVNPAVPTMGLTQGNSSTAPKSLKDRWSEFHGEGPKNKYDPNSKRDVAMLKAMEAAQGGGEKAIRAVANGPLSRPAMRPTRR